MTDRILIAEDEVDLLHGLGRTIEMELDCDIALAQNGKDALAIIERQPVDLLLTDIRMPDMDGMELLKRTRAFDPYITVVVMTAYGTIEQAVDAIKNGAYDFITKPFEEQQILHLLGKGLERNRLIRENQRLQQQVAGRRTFQGMIGASPAMTKAFKTIQMMGRTDVTVLIRGESGTGKEMAARAIHARSRRKDREMVTVNCPALPENILESELFGYRKGAFTNATQDKAGLFAKAQGSTIFLDEIGDLSAPLQTKLLRVLQEKEIKPLGDNRTTTVDVRILASTNQDLEEKIKDHSFREDLYYRLNVAQLTLEPLRQRREDIPLLADHFLKAAAQELNTGVKTLSPRVMERFLAHAWPGNVRELENTIQGLTALVTGDTIEERHLPASKADARQDFDLPDMTSPYKPLKEHLLEQFTTAYVTQLLARTQGNVSLAAQQSRIKRQSLQKILKRYGIDPAQFRE